MYAHPKTFQESSFVIFLFLIYCQMLMCTETHKIILTLLESVECHTHTRLTALFPGTTQVSWDQKGKTNLDFTKARGSEWQWHQLGHMKVCISLLTYNHASTPPLKFFYRPDALPAAQPTASKH